MESAANSRGVSLGGGIAAVLGLGLLVGSIVYGVNTRWSELAKTFLAGSAVMAGGGALLLGGPKVYTHIKAQYGEDDHKVYPDKVSYKGKTVTIQLQHTGRAFENSRYHISGLGWRKTYLGNQIPADLVDTAKAQLPYTLQ